MTVVAVGTDPDPGSPPLTFEFDFDNNGTFEQSNTNGVAQHTYGDDGVYPVKVRVSDDDGAEVFFDLDVTVLNVDPILELRASSFTDEGDVYTVALNSIDPGDDTLTEWTIDWGDGTQDVLPGTATQASHAYADDSGAGTFRVTATASDEDGTYDLSAVGTLASGFVSFVDGPGANGHIYLLTDAAGSHADAQAAARALGGQLVSITSQPEQEFVDSNFVDAGSGLSPLWTGLDRQVATAPNASVIYSASFEADEDGFTLDNDFADGFGYWHRSDGRRNDGESNHSPDFNLYFGFEEDEFSGGGFNEFVDANPSGAAISPLISLPDDGQDLQLSFNSLIDLEFFGATLNVRVDDGSPTPSLIDPVDSPFGLPDNTDGAWKRFTYDLTPYAGSDVRLRFEFQTQNAADAGEGWFIDDVMVTTQQFNVVLDGLNVEFDAVAPGPDATSEWRASRGRGRFGGVEGASPLLWQFNQGGAPAVQGSGLMTDRGGLDGAFTWTGAAAEVGQLSRSIDFGAFGFDATFEVWAKPADLSGKEVLLDIGGTQGLSLRLDDDQLIFNLQAANGVTLEARTTLLAEDIADFAQIVARVSRGDGFNSFIELYVNGHLRDTATLSPGEQFSTFDDGSASALGGYIDNIGGGVDSTDQGHFVGQIARVSQYNTFFADNRTVVHNFLALADPGTTYQWDDGDPITYLNFAGTDPLGSNSAMALVDRGDGTSFWQLYDPGDLGNSYRGIIELASIFDVATVPGDGLDLTVGNAAPTADAGPDQSVNSRDFVTVDGVFADPGSADTHTFLWQVQPPAGSPVIPDGTSEDFIFQPVAEGTYILDYTVTDDEGETASDQVIVNVSALVSAANAGPNQLVTEGDLVLIDGTFVDPGTTNGLVTYLWEVSSTSGQNVPDATTKGFSFRAVDDGVYTLTLTISDDVGVIDTDTAVVIANNGVPTLAFVADQSATEDLPLTITDLGTFTDPGFDNPAGSPPSVEAFTYSINWGDNTPLITGVADIDQVGAPTLATQGSFDGQHTYTTGGVYTVTVSVTDDDLGTDTRTFTVNVGAVNDPPLANPAALTTPEDSPVTIDLRTLASDLETANANLVFSVGGGINGTVQLLGDGHTAEFTPTAEFSGGAGFTYEVTDLGDQGTPALATGAAIDVSVTAVNDLPTAASATIDSPEGTTVAVDLRTLVTDVETLDHDLTFVVGDAFNGLVQLANDGYTALFSPASEFTGGAGFRYRVTDTGDGPAAPKTAGPVSIAVDVEKVNEAPVALPTTLVTDEEQTVELDLRTLVSDRETDVADLIFEVITPMQGTVQLVDGHTAQFTPANNYHGPASFEYRVTDTGNGSVGAITTGPIAIGVTVQPVNDPPTAATTSVTTAEDAGAIQIDLRTLVTDIETASLDLTFTLDAAVGGAVQLLPDNHTAEFTPAENFNGTAGFDYQVTDDGDGSAPQLTTGPVTVEIVVQPVNDPPVAVGASMNINQSPFGDLDLRTLVTDFETAPADFNFAVGGAVNGTVQLLPDGHTARFTPTPNTNGAASFTYDVADTGDGSSPTTTVGPRTIDVQVTLINNAPIAQSGTASTNEDTALQINLRAFASDAETATADLVFSLGGGFGGTFLLQPDGHTVLFTPTLNFNGLAGITYTATDTGAGGGAVGARTSAPSLIEISVLPVNEPPTLDPIGNRSAIVGNLLTLTARATDAADPSDTFTFSLEDGTAGAVPNGASIDPLTGVFEWIPNAPGTFTFDVVVTDDGMPNISVFETISVAVLTAPAVESITIDDGSGQRSMIRTISVLFNGIVNLDPDAIEVETDEAIPTAVSFITDIGVSVDGKTVVTLSMFGPGGSLEDGRYKLTVVADKVHAGAATMTTDEELDFHRYYGDKNGDEKLDFFDLAHFRSAFGTKAVDAAFDENFDANSDGLINFFDLAQFRGRFGTRLP